MKDIRHTAGQFGIPNVRAGFVDTLQQRIQANKIAPWSVDSRLGKFLLLWHSAAEPESSFCEQVAAHREMCAMGL
jgi:hypothetical protein